MGTAIKLDDIKRYEVTEVYSHPDAKVDIVLVHGLMGDPRRSWTAKNGTFWPTELLPDTLKTARARILVYGYNGDVYSFAGSRSASADKIHVHAQSMVSNLALERKSEDASENPIIWVAHSLGGILIKRALEFSNDLTSKTADDNRSIFVSTYGIIFLATPHTGADAAKWGLILQGMVDAIIPKKIMDTDDTLVKTLRTNNEVLQNINLHFLDIYQRFKICMVHEAVKTDLKGTKRFIVDQNSASPLLPDVQYFGIEATHQGISKFENKNSPGYLNVSTTIKSWVIESPPIIQARWDMERRARRQMKEAQAAELLEIYPGGSRGSPNANSEGTSRQDPQEAQQKYQPGLVEAPPPRTRFEFETAEVEEKDTEMAEDLSNSAITTTVSIEPCDENRNEPYFIKPSGFRPNSLFVGRQTELAEMHKMLFDKKRRSEGTSAVLIQSMPGGGKTHLARQYVYQHKNDFPGGIFWLRAKSQTELAAGFWDIARKAALKPSMANEDASLLEDPQLFIKLVRKWLKRRHDWLMIFDGIQFDDAEALRKFIPDSTDTSLIYTSTEKSVTGSHYLMNPQIIKLPLLSAREAQQLLLLELDRKRPYSTEDLRSSMELVQAMGLLPVVIHAVAQRLKTTDEPLSKFARSYASEPRLRGLGSYIAVVDQLKVLGACEALNLIHILSFFSQHIPVEMIVLGLKALDIPVKASEALSGRSLNNTFTMLNRFALIDRNELDSTLQSSQSSRGSREMLADNIDVVRIHSVVQGFFIDTLLADGSLPMWLDRAVRLLCRSYDKANERITRKANAGLVEDYRVYEINAIRLREHVTRYRKKTSVLDGTGRMLEDCLTAIQGQIERRTPESSNVIADGRVDAFQLSIFDRSSSSSDTGPETPGGPDSYPSRVSTWGMDNDQGQLQSPSSITHETNLVGNVKKTPNSEFPPLPIPDDPGYDSDREGSIAMTVQPSQRTLQKARSVSPGGRWETVRARRQRPVRLDLHRTIKSLERQRYHDSAGAFRAIGAIDPRLSREHAQGFLQRTDSRPQSRGRMSGQSSAEVALTHITKNSPPPARGGGMIYDRRPSIQRTVGRPHMVAGTVSYAAAVSGPTRDTAAASWEPVRQMIDPQESSSDSMSSAEYRPQSSAMASLQRIPHSKPPPSPQTSFTPMPPYPPSPKLSYQQPYPSSDSALYRTPSGENREENKTLGNGTYPRMTGPIPFERLRNLASSSLGKRDLPHDYPAWSSQNYPGSLPTSFQVADESLPPFLSFSSPTIKPSETYYPGHPEFSHPANQDGYSSQPMSRNASGQSASGYSAHSDPSARAAEQNRRRPSLADTEPLPSLPKFSPRFPPTSYQVYESLQERDWERERGRAMGRETAQRGRRYSRDRGIVRKSPRMGFAPAALIDRLDDWKLDSENTPPQGSKPPRREINPAAPSFTPWTSYIIPSLYPHAPPTSPQSVPSSAQNSPPPVPHATPESTRGARGSFREEGSLQERVRSTSAGVKVGRRVIEFGDFSAPDWHRLTREWKLKESERRRFDREGERVDRARAEREMVVRERADSVPYPSGGVGLGIREVR